MLKTISLISRKPDLPRAAFREHYETVHAPLALPHMTGLMRYVRYHVEEEWVGEFESDVLSAFWYRDAESAGEMMKTLAGEAGKPILADELTFMDKPKNTFFPVSERHLDLGKSGGPKKPNDEAEESVFVALRNPKGESRYDSSSRLVLEHWPKLASACGPLGFALLRDTFPIEGTGDSESDDGLRYNAVLQLNAAGGEGLREDLDRWSAGLVSTGYKVAVVMTRRFETALPSGGIV